MRLNLIKKLSNISNAYLITLVLAVVALLFKRNDLTKGQLIAAVVSIAIYSLVFSLWYSWYERTFDKKIVNDMVFDKKFVLARVHQGRFEKFNKDSARRTYPVWKLDITYYTLDGERHNDEMYEQFASEQTSIPSGYIYITFDPENPENKLVIPNALIASIEDNREIVETYQKQIKNLSYLNVYYKNGLVMESFEETAKKQKKQ